MLQPMDEMETQRRWETAQERYQAATNSIFEPVWGWLTMPVSKPCGWLFQTRQLADGSMWVFHDNSVTGSG